MGYPITSLHLKVLSYCIVTSALRSDSLISSPALSFWRAALLLPLPPFVGPFTLCAVAEPFRGHSFPDFDTYFWAANASRAYP